jgi:NitT/TauT family transport system substrate-binding protein
MYPNVKTLQDSINVTQEVGLIPAKIEVAPKYVDLSFVEEAKRRIEAGR